MTFGDSEVVRLIGFLIRILCLSAIAYPVMAEGTDYFPAPAEAIPPAGLIAPLQHSNPQIDVPAPALASPAAEELMSPAPAVAPFVGDACAPNYWIVSSRCRVQHVRQACRGPWGLDVYQRTPDGQLTQSQLPALSSQLVPGIPVCIFVHGSFVEWDSQCREAHSLYLRLRSASSAPLQMIFFTWPSDGPYTYVFPLDVAIRERQADFNGFHLAYLLSQIPESCPVSLIGHSHGARVVLSTLHMAGGGTVEGYTSPCAMGTTRRFRVVLAAAAMDHDELNPGKDFGCALNRVECLLNLRNCKDLPLALQPFSRPFARRALARSGITPHDVSNLGYNAAKIRQCDVAHLVGHAHLWPEYYKQPGIVAAMVPYVYFY